MGKKGTTSDSDSVAADIGDAEDAGQIQGFLWKLSSIGLSAERLENVWPSKLGVSLQQWMVLRVLLDLNQTNGATNAQLADLLGVNPSFVTTQSKALAKLGFLICRPHSVNAPGGLISLSARFRELFEALSRRRARLYRTVFSELGSGELERLTATLVELDAKMEKAARFAERDVDASMNETN